MSYIELHSCSAFIFCAAEVFPSNWLKSRGIQMPGDRALRRNGVYGGATVLGRGARSMEYADRWREVGDGRRRNLRCWSKSRRLQKSCELLTQTHLQEKGNAKSNG